MPGVGQVALSFVGVDEVEVAHEDRDATKSRCRVVDGFEELDLVAVGEDRVEVEVNNLECPLETPAPDDEAPSAGENDLLEVAEVLGEGLGDGGDDTADR